MLNPIDVFPRSLAAQSHLIRDIAGSLSLLYVSDGR